MHYSDEKEKPNRIQQHIFNMAAAMIQDDINKLNERFAQNVKTALTAYSQSLTSARAEYKTSYKSHKKAERISDALTYKLAIEAAKLLYGSRIKELESENQSKFESLVSTAQDSFMSSITERTGWTNIRSAPFKPAQALFFAILTEDLALKLSQQFATRINLEHIDQHLSSKEPHTLPILEREPVRINELSDVIRKYADGIAIAPQEIAQFVKSYTADTADWHTRTEADRSKFISKFKSEEAKRLFNALAQNPSACSEQFKTFTEQYKDQDSIDKVSDYVSKQSIINLAQRSRTFKPALSRADEVLDAADDEDVKSILKHAASVSSEKRLTQSTRKGFLMRILSMLLKPFSIFNHKDSRELEQPLIPKGANNEGASSFKFQDDDQVTKDTTLLNPQHKSLITSFSVNRKLKEVGADQPSEKTKPKPNSRGG